ncbi:MAG TPA: hypothetical protein VKA95_04130 [Nitrososphaeraceae archaeon]|nr:hypothetical protein [Nitrososphaeraceae archaeon]
MVPNAGLSYAGYFPTYRRIFVSSFEKSIIEAAIQSIRIGLRISSIAFHVSKTI